MANLIISSSLNPKSRSRLLALIAFNKLKDMGVSVEWLDLADHSVPLCDGDSTYNNSKVKELKEKVQNAIINLTKNKTTLVIAHRLSTIIRADKIILINRGEIADFGTHAELLKSSMIYKNLYSKQLSA